MATGDAFNRAEVASAYVGPKSRYVVSLIVGVAASDAASPEQAALIALGMCRGPARPRTVWMVHDRETGETFELQQVAFDEGCLSNQEPDPFPSG